MALKFKQVDCYVRDKARLMKFLTMLAEDDKEKSPEGLYSTLGKQFAAMWVCDEMGAEIGIIVFHTQHYRTGRCLSIVGAAGTCLQDWGSMTENFRELGASFGCVQMEMIGRRGFMKVFKPHGWKEKMVIIECKI